MTRTIANFKCKLCGDIFTATSKEYSSCQCGMSKVSPSEYQTAYDNKLGWNCERLHDGNDHTYYDENDLFIMTGEILELYADIKSLCNELDFYIYEDYETDEEDNEYLKYINISRSEFCDKHYTEQNEIEFKIQLDKPFNEDKFRKRLLDFKEFLINVKDNNVSISNRKQLTSDKLNLEWQREQLKYYDYTFYF